MEQNRKTPDATWWDHITGPSQLVNEVANILYNGKSVFLSAQVPFYATFFERVVDALRKMDNKLMHENVIDTEEDPGMNLIERFNLRAKYRPYENADAECLRKSGKLNDTLLSVVAERDKAKKWVDFTRTYKSVSLRQGLFLIKTDDGVPAASTKYLKALDSDGYNKFVSEYDTLLFAGLISDKSAQSVGEKRYISALSVSLFGQDAEAIAEFIDKYKIDISPFDVLPEGRFQDEESTYKLWNAQIQELFPLIMRETREFVDKWRKKIDDAFERIREERDYPNGLFPQGLLNASKEPIDSPDDLELAQIFFLMRNRRRSTGEFFLYLPDESARERIKLLYEMRNNIAHGKVCNESDVVRLLRK